MDVRELRLVGTVDDYEQPLTGAEVIAEPTRTPWNSSNARLGAPGGLQLTLFQQL
jgi:lactoylglutathione lyase